MWQRVEDGADITTSYALVNGKRSVYLPITKSADASTWEVVQNLKKAIPRFQALLPEDVKLSYVFDQSVYVINSVKSLAEEGAIGAVLTGLMVLLFLGDRRGALDRDFDHSYLYHIRVYFSCRFSIKPSIS